MCAKTRCRKVKLRAKIVTLAEFGKYNRRLTALALLQQMNKSEQNLQSSRCQLNYRGLLILEDS